MLQVSFFLASGSVSSLLPHHSNFQAYPNLSVKQPLSKTWRSLNKLFHKEGARWRQLSWAVVSLLGQTSQEVIFLDIEMTLLPNPRNPNWFSDLLCQLIRIFFVVTCCLVVSWQAAEKYTLGDLFFCQKALKAKLLPSSYSKGPAWFPSTPDSHEGNFILG